MLLPDGCPAWATNRAINTHLRLPFGLAILLDVIAEEFTDVVVPDCLSSLPFLGFRDRFAYTIHSEYIRGTALEPRPAVPPLGYLCTQLYDPLQRQDLSA